MSTITYAQTARLPALPATHAPHHHAFAYNPAPPTHASHTQVVATTQRAQTPRVATMRVDVNVPSSTRASIAQPQSSPPVVTTTAHQLLAQAKHIQPPPLTEDVYRERVFPGWMVRICTSSHFTTTQRIFTSLDMYMHRRTAFNTFFYSLINLLLT